jgi:signal transduction histidine kinase
MVGILKIKHEIFVEDNGIGFDEVYLDRIFTPFQRLHGGSAYEGSGMGLAICRKIMERYEGSITAQSRPDAGATFILTFPVNLLRALRRCAPHLPANLHGPEAGKMPGRRTVA